MSDITTSKDSALNTIYDLIEKFDISIKDIKEFQNNKSSQEKDSKWITNLFGYLGAAFIFGGLILFVGMIWDDLGSLARVFITYGSGLCAYIMAYIFTKEENLKKLISPFYLISAFMLPTGMFIFLKEYGDGNDAQLASIIVFGVLAIQFFLPYFKLKSTTLLFIAYAFFNASISPLLERVGVSIDWISLVMGISMMIFAYYTLRTKHHIIAPFWFAIGFMGYIYAVENFMLDVGISGALSGVIIAITLLVLGFHLQNRSRAAYTSGLYVIGSSLFFVCLYDLVEGKPYIDLITLVAAIQMMMISVKLQSRFLLAIATLALLGFLGYFTQEYFADIAGWPIALIILGFFLIGISNYAFKLGKSIKLKK